MKKTTAAVCCAILGLVLALSLVGCDWFSAALSPNPLPHLIAEKDAEANPVRPVDAETVPEKALEKPGRRARITELYEVVTGGFRPVFDGEEDEALPVYRAAVAMLNRYIRNDFSAFQTVHSIHDWLSYSIEYDNALYADYAQNNVQIDAETHPAFHLDGVFLDGVAVCDGISKAFNFLCSLENIRSYQVRGSYVAQTTDAHAWNKVYLDEQWYNVDATMDRAQYRISDGPVRSVMNHGYFLISDAAISNEIGRHLPFKGAENPIDYAAERDYPYFEHRSLSIGGKDYPQIVRSAEELNAIFAAVKGKRRTVGKLELQLLFENYPVDREGSFEQIIKTAYQKTGDSDFVFDGDYAPYFRYPNNVFLFLIYA